MPLKLFKRLTVNGILLGAFVALLKRLEKSIRQDPKEKNTDHVLYDDLQILDGKSVLCWFKENENLYKAIPEIVHVLIYPSVAETRLKTSIDSKAFSQFKRSNNIIVQAFYNQESESIEKYRIIRYKNISEGLKLVLDKAEFFNEGIIILEDNNEKEELLWLINLFKLFLES